MDAVLVIAQKAYGKYGWIESIGNPTPEWDELPLRSQLEWCAAVISILETSAPVNQEKINEYLV